MKATRPIRSLLVLSALGSLLSAQGARAGLSEPSRTQEASHAQAAEASAKPEPRDLSFNVTGLTAENLAKVKEGLTGLMSRAFACEACKVEQAKAGTCPKCQGALKEKSRAVFQKVQPSAETGMLSLTLDPGANLRLSELEGALAKSTVKIDATRFPLAGRSRLIVKGATADAVPAIEKALKDAKLFDEVKAKFDPATSELAVFVHAGATAPTKAKVAAALEGAKAQLADVVWGPPAGPKT